ncbi:MAG: hypothetical protein AAFO68_04280 [Pseudomonadota bacterium]
MKSVMQLMKMSLVGAAVVVGAQMFDATSHSAEAKQCVWNKAGFVLRVEWYQTGQVFRDTKGTLYTRPNARPTQTDVFPIAQGRCLNRNTPHVAILKIEGQEWVKKGLQIGLTTATAVGAGIAGAVVCAGTVGAGCPAAAAGVAAAVGGVATAGGEFIPEPKNIGAGAFGTSIPPSNRWIDVWGTVWDPQVGPGGYF